MSIFDGELAKDADLAPNSAREKKRIRKKMHRPRLNASFTGNVGAPLELGLIRLLCLSFFGRSFSKSPSSRGGVSRYRGC